MARKAENPEQNEQPPVPPGPEQQPTEQQEAGQQEAGQQEAGQQEAGQQEAELQEAELLEADLEEGALYLSLDFILDLFLILMALDMLQDEEDSEDEQ